MENKIKEEAYNFLQASNLGWGCYFFSMNDGNNVRCSLMWQVHYISAIACRKLISHMTMSKTAEKK